MDSPNSTKEALQQASDIFNNIQLGIYIYHLENKDDDKSLRLVSANPATEHLTGVPTKNVIGHTLDENFPGLREKGIPQKYADVVRKQQAIEIEDLYYGDNRVIEGAFSIKAFPLPNDHVGVSFENITVRKKAETELIESESHYKLLFHNSPVGICYYDHKYRIMDFNDKFVEIFKTTRENLIEFDLQTVKDKRILKSIYDAIEGKMGNYEGEYIATISNAELYFSIQSAPCTFVHKRKKIKGGIIIIQDITERKEAEKKLQISEEKHRRLIETMNDGFAILDENGIISYANSKLCRMMGFERAELIGHPTIDFLDKVDIENLQKHAASRATKSSVPYEVEWTRKDGNKIPTIVSPSPIFNAKGDFTGSMAVLTDISELKKIESELLTKNSELEETLYKLKNMHTQLVISEKMASLGQITAGVAHEINNPINYIKGNIKPLKNDVNDIIELIAKYETIIKTQNIANRFDDVESHKKKIDYTYLIDEINSLFKGIEDGANRTTEIIKSLRNFSRLEKDEFIKSDVHEGINSTLVILNNLIKERIIVHKDFQGASSIECLPGKLNQVFMNILTNAIQAIDNKGEIFISTKTDEKHFTISIRDTGKGMSEAVVNHVFEPFFSTKEPGKGTGLGLSISHNIIEKHKGNIIVNSSPGKGTEFLIHLPLVQSG